MEIISIKTLEELQHFLATKHNLSVKTSIEDIYKIGLIDQEYAVYSFQDSAQIRVSYNVKPSDLKANARKVFNFTCGLKNISIEETTYRGDYELVSTIIRHEYIPFDLLVLFKGSSVILYISLATDPDLLMIIRGYANNVVTHYNV